MTYLDVDCCERRRADRVPVAVLPENFNSLNQPSSDKGRYTSDP